MNLQRAIEIKESYQHLHRDEYFQELIEADNLSIEALKRIQHYRVVNPTYRERPLPGETDD